VTTFGKTRERREIRKQLAAAQRSKEEVARQLGLLPLVVLPSTPEANEEYRQKKQQLENNLESAVRLVSRLEHALEA
jgi:RNase P protein component